MPYIQAKEKQELLHDGRPAASVGELTFLLTHHALQDYTQAGDDFAVEAMCNEISLYLDAQQRRGNYNYGVLCGVVGSLECARREYRRRRPDAYIPADDALSEVLKMFYDRTVARYEDTKIEQNGDVF
jgi:hypothetical protein